MAPCFQHGFNFALNVLVMYISILEFTLQVYGTWVAEIRKCTLIKKVYCKKITHMREIYVIERNIA